MTWHHFFVAGAVLWTGVEKSYLRQQRILRLRKNFEKVVLPYHNLVCPICTAFLSVCVLTSRDGADVCDSLLSGHLGCLELGRFDLVFVLALPSPLFLFGPCLMFFFFFRFSSMSRWYCWFMRRHGSCRRGFEWKRVPPKKGNHQDSGPLRLSPTREQIQMPK
jgi:hypothetical protein